MANPEQMSMDAILSDEPEEKKKPEPAKEAPAAEPEPDAAAAVAAEEEQRKEDYKSRRTKAREKEAIAQGKVRDPDTGQFVSPEKVAAPAAPETPKEAPKSEPAKAAPAAPQQEFTDKEKAFLRAAQEERNKRQALERQIAELQAGKNQEPAKTFWDDPEGALAKQKQEVQQAILSTRLATSEAIARNRYPDFDEKLSIFAQLARETEGLAEKMAKAPDAAEFVYRTAKNHKDLADAGGVDQLVEKAKKETEARVRAQIEAEFKAKAEADAKQRANLPGSLSDARAVGGASKPVWQGPTSMDEILKG